jgi:uncharacterized protein (DUF488 family)
VSDESSSARILTVGHSTRSLAEFIELLRAHGIEHVVDVRTVPRSRRNPQFNAGTLPAALEEAGIAYTHLPGLGGLRRPGPGSANGGWRNRTFRGYADYIQTQEFEANLRKLVALAARRTVALMCAEAVPWRCHRSLIADALLVRGVAVDHILSSKRRLPHTMTPWAQVEGTRVTYPPPPGPDSEPSPPD